MDDFHARARRTERLLPTLPPQEVEPTSITQSLKSIVDHLAVLDAYLASAREQQGLARSRATHTDRARAERPDAARMRLITKRTSAAELSRRKEAALGAARVRTALAARVPPSLRPHIGKSSQIRKAHWPPMAFGGSAEQLRKVIAPRAPRSGHSQMAA